MSANTHLLWYQGESKEVHDDVKQSEHANRRSSKGQIIRKEHDPNTKVKAPSGAVVPPNDSQQSQATMASCEGGLLCRMSINIWGHGTCWLNFFGGGRLRGMRREQKILGLFLPVFSPPFSPIPLELSSEVVFQASEVHAWLTHRHACIDIWTVLSVSRMFFCIPHFSIEVLGRWGDGEW